MPESNEETSSTNMLFTPHKTKKVKNANGTYGEIFENDFFNMSWIPEIFKITAKILEYDILLFLPELYKEPEKFPWWKNISFLEICENWSLLRLLNHDFWTWWNLWAFFEGRIKDFVDQINDYNLKVIPIKVNDIVKKKKT